MDTENGRIGMALTISAWNVRHVGASGHGCVMNFDSRYNGRNWDNRVPLSKIAKRPSWEVYVDFSSPPLDPNDPSYPCFANIFDNENFFQVPLKNKYSMRAGIQYADPESYGPIPSGTGRHNVRIELLNRDRQLLLTQSGYYVIEPG